MTNYGLDMIGLRKNITCSPAKTWCLVWIKTAAFLSSGMDHAPPCTAKTIGAPGISGYHGISEYILILVGGWATPMKNISQLGWLFPIYIYGKIKNVWNHQLLMLSDAQISYFCSIQMYIPCLRPCWIILVTIFTTSVDTPGAKIGNVWIRFPANQHL